MSPARRHACAWLAALGLLLGGVPAAEQPRVAACPRCGWRPPAARIVRTVGGVAALRAALRDAAPGTTILLEDGEYRLDRTLSITVPGVALRGKSGDPAKAIIRGGGLTSDGVGVALSVSAPEVTLADVSVGLVRFHAVQVRGERSASGVMLHNLHLFDTGQQLLKVTGPGPYADEGLVACSVFEYTNHAPSDYTNGIDVLAGKGWTVRDNRFLRIRGPAEGGWKAGPAILFWSNSQNTVIERNLILDSFRGIAAGLGPGRGPRPRDGERRYDHQGGIIRNNVVCNLNPWGNEGIEANAARDLRIEHNTVLVEGTLNWSVSLRFPETEAQVRNNLTNRPIVLRRGARAMMEGNLAGATPDWFVASPRGDLHLSARGTVAVGAGVSLPDVAEDFDRQPRPSGRRPTVGAFEGARPAGGQPFGSARPFLQRRTVSP